MADKVFRSNEQCYCRAVKTFRVIPYLFLFNSFCGEKIN